MRDKIIIWIYKSEIPKEKKVGILQGIEDWSWSRFLAEIEKKQELSKLTVDEGV